MLLDKEEFTNKALNLLNLFAQNTSEFLIEDVRLWAYNHKGLEEPFEPRWWGGVTNSAKKNGIIESTGKYELTEIGARPQVLWRSKVVRL